MNKYWIHKDTGSKAKIIFKYPDTVNTVKLIWKNEDYSNFEVSKDSLKRYFIPITKVEYDSSLTLEEIKKSRNITKEIEGFSNFIKQYVYDNRIYKLGDLFITKTSCKVSHSDQLAPKNTLCYIYQIIENANGSITIYLRTIPSIEYRFEDVIVTTPTDLSDILNKIKINTINKEDEIEDRLKKENPIFVKQYNATKKALELMKDKDSFESICQEMIATHKAKNHDYGDSFHNLFKELGINYAYGHLREKLERIKTLKDNKAKVRGESMVDSLKDLANYAIMTIIELENG